MENESAYRGLSLHPGTPAFLARAYGVTLERTERGLPIYRDKNGKRFWGGWGSFYTICLDGDASQLAKDAAALGRSFGLIEGCFSLADNAFNAKHVHVMLTVPEDTAPEARMSLYSKAARNQTKRAREAALTLSIERGTISQEWYGLYVRTMQRLESDVKDFSYFKALEECFGDSLYCVLARDGAALVGSTMYIRHGDYVHLLSNISETSHWHLRVNNLVYDEMVRKCIEDGVRYIDYGLTGVRDKQLLGFKKDFGGAIWYITTRTFGSPTARSLDIAKRAFRALRRKLFS